MVDKDVDRGARLCLGVLLWVGTSCTIGGVDLDHPSFLLHLSLARSGLDLDVPVFNERLHPRGPGGRWIESLRSLKVGDTATFPHGVKAKRGSGGYHVTGVTSAISAQSPELAARAVQKHIDIREGAKATARADAEGFGPPDSGGWREHPVTAESRYVPSSEASTEKVTGLPSAIATAFAELPSDSSEASVVNTLQRMKVGDHAVVDGQAVVMKHGIGYSVSYPDTEIGGQMALDVIGTDENGVIYSLRELGYLEGSSDSYPFGF